MRLAVAAVTTLALAAFDSGAAAPRTTDTMVKIRGGRFLMGSPPSEPERENSEDQHEVTVASFEIDRTEVTNAQFQRFVRSHPEWRKERAPAAVRNDTYLQDWTGTQFPKGRGDHPVGFVSWFAAQAYCAALGKRLPTEPEWEYAARAGTTTPYWWGAEFDAARGVSLGSSGTRPVGEARRINGWGLADMAGNVWEWTSTEFRSYPYRPDDGREGEAGELRVSRGGAWDNPAKELRSAARGRDYPQNGGDCVGFRCAR